MAADTTYGRRPWTLPTLPDQAVGPFAPNKERLTSERLMAALLESPPSYEQPLFRPRFGYNRAVPGILDVLDVDEEFPQPVDTFSRDTYGSYSGSATPGYSNDLGKP